MPVQFGIDFKNHIPAVLKYQDQKVRHAVDDLVQPILTDFPQDTLTLVARTAQRSKVSGQVEDRYLNAVRIADVSGGIIAHIDTHIFKNAREQVKAKLKTEVKLFPCDLEFAIQQQGQDRKVFKFIPPQVIPMQTDYFFTKNIPPDNARPALQQKLRTELAQTLQEQYNEQQALLSLHGTLPAENPGWFLPEFDPTQWLQ